MKDYLKRQELNLERRRLDLEARRVEHEERKTLWKNPLFIGAVLALIGLFGNAVVAFVSGLLERELEQQKADASLVLESLKTGTPEAAKKKLQFLAETKLVRDTDLQRALMELRPEDIPVLSGSMAGETVMTHFDVSLVLGDGSVVPGTGWFPQDDFIRHDGKIDRDLSGVACPKSDLCVISGDKNRYTSLFTLIEPNIVQPLQLRIYLEETDKEEEADLPELDIEAVSYDREELLFVGSHSVKRSSACRIDDRHNLYLVPAVSLGEKTQGSSLGKPPTEVQRASLDYFFKEHKEFEDSYDDILQLGGLKIEGAALADGRVYIGVRAPAPDKQLLILDFAKDELFGGGEPQPRFVRLEVDRIGIGIRDMAKIKEGFLILTGDAEAEAPQFWSLYLFCEDDFDSKGSRELRFFPRAGRNVGNPFELYFWNGEDEEVHWIGEFFGSFPSIVDVVKAESMLVLPAPWTDDEVLKLLFWFDGIRNGAPTSFSIPRRLLPK